MCLKTYTKLNGRVGFSLKIIIAILTRVCFMRKLTLNISKRPIPILAVPYAKIMSSNWQQINALSLYCIISCCISIGDCMKSTFSDREYIIILLCLRTEAFIFWLIPKHCVSHLTKMLHVLKITTLRITEIQSLYQTVVFNFDTYQKLFAR